MTLHTASPNDFTQQVLVPLAEWSSIWPYAPGDYTISANAIWVAVDPVLGVTPASPEWTEVVSGSGVPVVSGITYSSPCLTVGDDTDNQAEVCGSESGDPVTISAVGTANLELRSSGTQRALLGEDAHGEFGLFLTSSSAPWLSTIEKSLNVEPGRRGTPGQGYSLTLSTGEPNGTNADGGDGLFGSTAGIGTGRGGLLSIVAGAGDLTLGTGGGIQVNAGDGATPGDIAITAGGQGTPVARGNVTVTATTTAIIGTMTVSVRTGSSAATYACFTAGGQLVESAIPCV